MGHTRLLSIEIVEIPFSSISFYIHKGPELQKFHLSYGGIASDIIKAFIINLLNYVIEINLSKDPELKMFEINDWSDVDDTADTNIGHFGNTNTCKKSKKKRKKQANELKTKSKLSVPNLNDKTKIAVTNLVTSKFKDRFLNSPTLTTSLVDNDDTQQNNKLKTTK